MMKPGGAIDQVGKFLEDVSNPKTEAGQTFIQVKDAIAGAVTAVKEFFAFFGDGNAVKGFANIASSLVQALPALLALKAIMTLASGGKAIASLVTAMSIIAGKSVTPTAVPPVAAINPITAIAVGSQAATLAAASTAQDIVNKDAAKTGMKFNVVSATFTGSMALPQSTTGGTWWDRMKKPATNVTINVNKADPKATVDALSAYLKQNGSLPSQLFWNARN
jgi:prophage DNA circulation protein